MWYAEYILKMWCRQTFWCNARKWGPQPCYIMWGRKKNNHVPAFSLNKMTEARHNIRVQMFVYLDIFTMSDQQERMKRPNTTAVMRQKVKMKASDAFTSHTLYSHESPWIQTCETSLVLWSHNDSTSASATLVKLLSISGLNKSFIIYAHTTTVRQKPSISNCSIFRNTENYTLGYTKACNPSNEFIMSVTTCTVTIVSPNISKTNCLHHFITPSFW